MTLAVGVRFAGHDARKVAILSGVAEQKWLIVDKGLIVQRIGRRFPVPKMRVRFLLGLPNSNARLRRQRYVFFPAVAGDYFFGFREFGASQTGRNSF